MLLFELLPSNDGTRDRLDLRTQDIFLPLNGKDSKSDVGIELLDVGDDDALKMKEKKIIKIKYWYNDNF